MEGDPRLSCRIMVDEREPSPISGSQWGVHSRQTSHLREIGKVFLPETEFSCGRDFQQGSISTSHVETEEANATAGDQVQISAEVAADVACVGTELLVERLA